MQGKLVITDGSTDISCDEQVQQLQPGQRLLVRPEQQGADQPVFKVGITQPISSCVVAWNMSMF
jgi:hypothetical protein